VRTEWKVPARRTDVLSIQVMMEPGEIAAMGDVSSTRVVRPRFAGGSAEMGVSVEVATADAGGGEASGVFGRLGSER
jgi:hypothetical protein